MTGTNATPVSMGPLRLHPRNPRYFTDGTGECILLAGAQTWATLQDRRGPETPLFDYDAWLAFLVDHSLNYMRMWTWEHPYGMSGAPIQNDALLHSPADWIGPVQEGSHPGRAPHDFGARKVVIADTDHLGFSVSDPMWPWRCMLNGTHFCIMDPYMDTRHGSPRTPVPEWDGIRRQAGLARKTLAEIGPANLTPSRESVEGSEHCLSSPGTIYVALVPNGEIVIADALPDTSYSVRWLDTRSESWTQVEHRRSEQTRLRLRATSPSHNLVHVWKTK